MTEAYASPLASSFSRGWRYKIAIKHLWQDRTDDDDAQAIAIAPEVARRVADLARRVSAKLPYVAIDLEEIAERFEDVPRDEEPSRSFNDALGDLYDLGDSYRIWIG